VSTCRNLLTFLSSVAFSFGLATTGVQHVKARDNKREPDDLSLSDSTGAGEATRANVGTPMYCAPEQEVSEGETAATRYNNKVDIFAVGIIFFEMCWKFGTKMERFQTLTNVKRAPEPDDALPSEFRDTCTNEAELIAWCLRRDPRDRPSAAELLQSDLMPRRMEEELLQEALHQVTDRNASVFETLMERLFETPTDPFALFNYEPHRVAEGSRPPIPAAAIGDFPHAAAAALASSRSQLATAGGLTSPHPSSDGLLALESESEPKTNVLLTNDLFRNTGGVEAAVLGSDELAIRERVAAEIAQICKRHGAVPFEPPLLMPVPSDSFLPSNALGRVTKLMDATGQLLSLPIDLTLPFARYVTHHGVTSARRFTVSKVYRRVGTSDGRSHSTGNLAMVQDIQEGAFDIVTPNPRAWGRVSGPAHSSLVYDAEVVRVMLDFVDRFQPQFGDGEVFVRVNHARVFGAMLLQCGVDDASIDAVCNAVTRWQKLEWELASERLQGQQLITPEAAASIGRFFKLTRLAPTFAVALSKLEMLLKRSRLARDALAELRAFSTHCRALGIEDRVRMDLGMMLNPAYYDSVVFQAVHPNGDVLATGGRYDKLLSEFAAGGPVDPSIASIETSAARTAACAVGCIFNFERITLACLRHRKAVMRSLAGGRRPAGGTRVCGTEVLVGAIGQNMLEARVEVCSKLWGANISAEYLLLDKSRSDRWPSYEQMGVPILVIVRDKTWRQKASVGVRNMRRSSAGEVEVHIDDLANHLTAMLTTVRKRRNLAQAANDPATANANGQHPSMDTHAQAEDASSSATPRKSQDAAGENQGDTALTTAVDILLLDEVRTTRQKKTIFERAEGAVLSWSQKFSRPPSLIHVLATELPRNVLQAIVFTYDQVADLAARGRGTAASDSAADVIVDLIGRHGIEKSARFFDSIVGLWDALQLPNIRALPFVVLYATKDHSVVVLTLM
jgi:histidyl-tRNA synthetase